MTEEIITRTDGESMTTTPNIETKLSVDEMRYKMCREVANLYHILVSEDLRPEVLGRTIEKWERVRENARKVMEIDTYDRVILEDTNIFGKARCGDFEYFKLIEKILRICEIVK